MLQGFWPQYDKCVDFSKCQEGYESAVQRAKALDHLAESVGDPMRNPTTGVYRLTEQIRVAE